MLSKTSVFLLLLPTRAFVHPPVGLLRNRQLFATLHNRPSRQNTCSTSATRTFGSSMKRKGDEDNDTVNSTSAKRTVLAEESPQPSSKTIRGDLLQLAQTGKFDVIVHGCNCFCAMGAGIAKQIRDQFTEAYVADKQTANGDESKLGTYSSATVDIIVHITDGDDNQRDDQHSVTIVNAYTQYHWEGEGVLAEYDAIRKVFAQIKTEFPGKRIGYPKIGAGLAGGDWDRISSIINDELEGESHTLVIYQP
jgi:O-acetyl-ADP-ribose deacetylase (regulator of RNase III)